MKKLVLFAVSCAACSLLSSNLSRDGAQKLLEAQSEFSTPYTQAELTADRLAGGQQEGLWLQTPSGRVQLTPEGQAHFASMRMSSNLLGTTTILTFKAPMRRALMQITGIREIDKTNRLAEFTWRFEGTDEIVRRYAGAPANAQFAGEAAFQKYDEGWRVSRLAMPFTPAPYAVDPAAAQRASKLAAERAVGGLVGTWSGTRGHYGIQSEAMLELYRQGSGLVGRGTYATGCSSILELVGTQLDRFTLSETFSTTSGCRPNSTSTSVTVRPGDTQDSIHASWEGGDLRGADGLLTRVAGVSERPAPSAQALAKEAIDAEQARLERARVATTATRVIGTYRFARGPRELVITDVGLTLTYFDYGSAGNPLVRNAGYWEVREVELQKDQEDRTRSLELVVRLEGRDSMRPMATGGRLQGDATPEAVFDQLNAAMRAWKQRYPDRTSWTPANY